MSQEDWRLLLLLALRGTKICTAALESYMKTVCTTKASSCPSMCGQSLQISAVHKSKLKAAKEILDGA